jgi:MinD superfamily P-loop ATPase
LLAIQVESISIQSSTQQEYFMSSLNFIGGEKGGVGKSVVARVLAQYFIDNDRPFLGFDTDRSHTSFTRFYADYASPVIVDSYEGLDAIANAFEEGATEGPPPSVIVDLAAQTAAPLTRWIKDSDLFAVLADMGVTVNFWHVADAGKESVDLLGRLVNTFENGPRYFVVKNYGRGSDFSQLESSAAMEKALSLGAQVVNVAQLHEASMRKIDRQNISFWAAIHTRPETDGLGLLERQRVKTWLKKTYESFDNLAL